MGDVKSFIASYDCKCGICGETIKAGEPYVWMYRRYKTHSEDKFVTHFKAHPECRR